VGQKLFHHRFFFICAAFFFLIFLFFVFSPVFNLSLIPLFSPWYGHALLCKAMPTTLSEQLSRPFLTLLDVLRACFRAEFACQFFPSLFN